ncbi:MAG: orotate phosphoribosyltransferase [Planctomycetes bacterium]|nr:orotate phosphoribosyltransferase [Planctomycetota bacterium]
METYQEEFVRFLLEEGALLAGSFTLKSGRRSPYFVNAGALANGGALGRLGEFYAEEIRRSAGDADLVFGPAYKGIPLAVAAAIAYARTCGRAIAYAFDRKEAKQHGDKGRFVGADLDGRNVVIVDDVLTAGTSIRAVAPLLSAAGARIACAVVGVDRQERAGDGTTAASRAIERDLGFPVHAIVRIRDALLYARDREIGGRVHVDGAILEAFEAYQREYGAA